MLSLVIQLLLETLLVICFINWHTKYFTFTTNSLIWKVCFLVPKSWKYVWDRKFKNVGKNEKKMKKSANFVKVMTFSFISFTILAQLRVNFVQVRFWFCFSSCDLFKVRLISSKFCFNNYVLSSHVQSTCNCASAHIYVLSSCFYIYWRDGIILHNSQKLINFSFRELWRVIPSRSTRKVTNGHAGSRTATQN